MGAPYTFIIVKKDGTFYCMICDHHMPTFEVAERHGNGYRHAVSYRQHGHRISFVRDVHQYFCRCCCCKICGWPNVYRHLIGRRHADIARQSDEVSAALRRGLSNNFILRISGDTFRCALCTCEMAGMSAANQHITDNRHVANMNENGRDIAYVQSNDQYYCNLCKCQFRGYYYIWGHLNGQQHRLQKAKEQRALLVSAYIKNYRPNLNFNIFMRNMTENRATFNQNQTTRNFVNPYLANYALHVRNSIEMNTFHRFY